MDEIEYHIAEERARKAAIEVTSVVPPHINFTILPETLVTTPFTLYF